jgi:hypothetical protein
LANFLAPGSGSGSTTPDTAFPKNFGAGFRNQTRRLRTAFTEKKSSFDFQSFSSILNSCKIMFFDKQEFKKREEGKVLEMFYSNCFF